VIKEHLENSSCQNTSGCSAMVGIRIPILVFIGTNEVGPSLNRAAFHLWESWNPSMGWETRRGL